MTPSEKKNYVPIQLPHAVAVPNKYQIGSSFWVITPCIRACLDLSLQSDKLGKQDIPKMLFTDNLSLNLLLNEGREVHNQKVN